MIARAADPRNHVVDYPASDGEPVGETEVHVEEILSLIGVLKLRYRDAPDVYAGGKLLFYYEEGNPAARFSPDVFVALGVPKRLRRIYKIWEERRAPAFVLEVSSRGTWLEDAGNKKALCARLGVQEYFLFDPEGDYLDPPLQGHRLEGGDYGRIAAQPDGAVRSEALGLLLSVVRLPDRLRLRCTDAKTGERLLRYDEEPDARRDAEERAKAAEAEVERLRRLLASRGG